MLGDPDQRTLVGGIVHEKIRNLKDTYVVLRSLTIKNAKIYYGSLRLLRIRNKGI